MLSAPQMQFLLGKATWAWDDELGMHIPVCSRWKVNRAGNIVRCGNGPLEGDAITEGTCSEGPHLERHERAY